MPKEPGDPDPEPVAIILNGRHIERRAQLTMKGETRRVTGVDAGLTLSAIRGQHLSHWTPFLLLVTAAWLSIG